MTEKFIASFLSAAIVFVSSASTQAQYASVENTPAPAVEIMVLGEDLYVSLRSVALALGDVDVSWAEERETAVLSGPGVTMEATNGGVYITANGRFLYTPNGIHIIDGHMMVQAEAIAKVFGATLETTENKVSFTKGPAAIAPAEAYYNSEDLYWLSRIIHAESVGESLDGKIAVGNVVMNRVKSNLFPDSIYDVIFDREYGIQFSPASNGSIYNTPAQDSEIAAMIVLEGYNNAGDSLYFLNPTIATSSWITNNCDYLLTIGNHSFYE